MRQYIGVDRFFANYDKGLSRKLGIAADYCDRAANEVGHLVDTFPYAEASTASRCWRKWDVLRTRWSLLSQR
jgi:hypothetical protein